MHPPSRRELLWLTLLVTSSDVRSVTRSVPGWPYPSTCLTNARATLTCSGRPQMTRRYQASISAMAP